MSGVSLADLKALAEIRRELQEFVDAAPVGTRLDGFVRIASRLDELESERDALVAVAQAAQEVYDGWVGARPEFDWNALADALAALAGGSAATEFGIGGMDYFFSGEA